MQNTLMKSTDEILFVFELKGASLELGSKELNHLAAILHVYAGGFIIFQKENGNTFTLLITFIVKSLQKDQNITNLLL